MQWRNSFAAMTASMAACLVTTNAQAQSAFEGFYGQLGAGYQFFNDKSTNATFKPTGSSTIRSQSITNATPQGFAGTIALGYNKAITKNYLLGFGAEYNPFATNEASRTITTSAGTSFQGHIKQNSYYNIFITPTYSFDEDKVVYLKAGWSQSNASNPYISYNQSGPSFGLGYKQFFSGSWYGFAEANYIVYGNTTYSIQIPASDTRGSGISSATNSGNMLSGLAGIGYKF
jgi:outer membrane immunogenic protein